MTDTTEPPILETRRLRKVFSSAAFGRPVSTVVAIDGLDLVVGRGETVGIVGESGCGKTTVARCVIRLERPTSGEITFEDVSVSSLAGPSLKAFRRDMQIVFQDPFAALDPHFTVERTLAEPLRVHGVVHGPDIRARTVELLESVGLSARFLDRHRHQLSGGEAQRVGIARALASGPRFLVLDEPTSALDASARAQIIALLLDLKAKLGMTYLLISHDLATVRQMCDRVLVMYLGRVVEDGPAEALFRRPQHPYTEALLSATPVPDPDQPRRAVRLRGELRSLSASLDACALAPRCPYAVAECSQRPQSLEVVQPDHRVRCHRVSSGELMVPPLGGPRSAAGSD